MRLSSPSFRVSQRRPVWRTLTLTAAAALFGLAGRASIADLSQAVFHRFVESEDFASVATLSVGQDQQGFMWIGTRSGLYRYDASEFLEYRNRADDPNSLGDNWVERIFFDRDGAMWLCLGRGIARYDSDLDRFINYTPGGESNAIKGVAQSGDGTLFAVSEGGLFLRYDPGADRFDVVGERLPEAVKSLFLDADGMFWVGGTFGLIALDSDARPIRRSPMPVTETQRKNVFVSSMAQRDRGSIWLGTNGYGAWILDIASGEYQPVPLADPNDILVGSLLVDEARNVLIGTASGLTVIEDRTGESIRYRHNKYNPRSIQDGTLYALFEDDQQNLWIGTSRGGLSAVFNAKRFGALEHQVYDPAGLTKEKVSALLEDSAGRLWVGYHNDGIDLLEDDVKIRYFDSFAEEEPRIGRGTVFAFHEDDDGTIWFSTNWSGLQRLDPSLQIVVRFVPDANIPDSIGGRDVRIILPDDAGNFWLALHGSGVGYYDRNAEAFSMLDGLEHPWVEDLLLDPEGGLWVASSEGLSYFEKARPPSVHYSAIGPAATALSDRHVKCLLWEDSDAIWAGTLNGLNRLDIETGTNRTYGLADGLPSNSIRSLIADDAGRIWVGTGRGLAVYLPAEDRFNAYTKSDGLVSGELVDRSAHKLGDGRLLFGTERGVLRFHPDEISANNAPPPVVITGISVFNKPLRVEEGAGAILKRSPWTAESVEFPAGMNSFSFRFSALNYLSPERNRYAYRLEGFDEDWVQIGAAQSATYTNIDPGRYRFRVIASNNDGVWNETGASLAIAVAPFYWQTAWFWWLTAAFAGALLATAYLLRVRDLARQRETLSITVAERTRILQDALAELEQQSRCIEDQNLELVDHRENLEQLIRQRTEELEAAKRKAEQSDRLKTAFLENMTHEIRTPMNAIIGFLNILKHKQVSEEERSEYTSIVERNGRALLVLIDDILDLSRMEAGELALQRNSVDLEEMFRDLRAYYQKVAKEKNDGVEIVWKRDDSQDGPAIVMGDEVRLQQVVSNLMDNALKFTESGHVEFGFRVEDREGEGATLFIHVQDSGVGIDEEAIASIFERFRKFENHAQKLYRGIGLGLAIVKKLVELMQGRIVVQSKLGEGTRFEIEIPTRRERF